MAICRLVCSGILAKYPDLTFIIHHCGSGIIPVLAGRIDAEIGTFQALGMKWGQQEGEDPFDNKRPADYFKMFYADTALNGDDLGLTCGHQFFGVEKILFGTDFPYDTDNGDKYIRQTIESVNKLKISDIDKKKIFEENAKRLLRLNVSEKKRGNF